MRLQAAFLAVACVTVLSSCSTSPEDTPLGKAHGVCVDTVDDALSEDSEFDGGTFASLGDEGQSLSIGSPSVDEEGEVGDLTANLFATITATLASCTLDELDGPDSIRRKMESTTAMMGRQTDAWDEYEVSWSYHPDNGFDATFEKVGE